MPYITKKDRIKFETSLSKILQSYIQEPFTTGELNYLITKIIHMYIEEKGLKYEYINDVIGVLECAKTEFERRVVGPYEEKKIKENGDI